LTSCGHRDESKTISISSSAGAHLTYVKGPRMMLRPAAKLDGVRLHDLRHSFASVGAAHGLSLAIVGKLLGHATPGGGVPQTCHVALLGVASLGCVRFDARAREEKAGSTTTGTQS
jgi:hypothetical protein